MSYVERESVEADATIILSPAQALLLLDLLSRWSDEAGIGETPNAACFQSTAEAAVLNVVCGSLEKQVTAVFGADYITLVAEARDRFAADWSYPTLRG